MVGSFFGSTQNVPSTKRTLRNLCGRISQDQTDDDGNKTLAVFKGIQRNDPEFTYRVQGDEESSALPPSDTGAVVRSPSTSERPPSRSSKNEGFQEKSLIKILTKAKSSKQNSRKQETKQ